MRIAEEAQAQFGRQVSWGARVGDRSALFHTASVPVMTRLRMDERQVLDTLIEQEGAAQRKLVEGRSPDAFEAGADRGRGRALNDIADAVRRAKPNPERAPLP